VNAADLRRGKSRSYLLEIRHVDGKPMFLN
jgi:hypothetical protein